MTRMEEPPFLIDGARVLAYASLAQPGRQPRYSLVVGGVTLDPRSVSQVAITQSLVDSAAFLLHCNERWETVAAATHPDERSARAAAEAALSGLTLEWVPYRPLNDLEKAEVASTTRFLRELASGGLDE